MSDTTTTAERAYIASLPSELEQDEAAERRYQLEQHPLAQDLLRLVAYAEALKAGEKFHDPDVVTLAEKLLDVLGATDDLYLVNAVLED